MWKFGIAAAGCSALAAAGLLARSSYERGHFVTETFEICSHKIREKEKRLVFLSDLHNNEFGQHNEKLISAIAALKPAAVLVGGDMMVCRQGTLDLQVTLGLMERLTALCPVCYANGNHEDRMRRERENYGDSYDCFIRELRQMGVRHLDDRSEELEPDLRITGCGMREKYYRHRFTVPKLPEGEIESRVGKADRERFQILLLHSPLFFHSCRSWGADLTLSGHFHGGTIRLPLLGGVMTPQYQFFLPWAAGRFDREGKTMIVSRGLGTHSINIRLNNRPQLVCVKLTPGAPFST